MSFSAPKSPFDPQSLTYQAWSAPLTLLATKLYDLFVLLRPVPPVPNPAIKVVAISDTHTQTRSIPSGDLLIHSGDLADVGSVQEIQAQIDWLSSLPFTHKVVIAGNHDTFLDPRSRSTLSEIHQNGQLDWKSVHYLQHSSVQLKFPKSGGRRLRIYGAPQIPACGGPEFAFQYDRNEDAWTDTIPDVDVLVTHTPPFAHLDLPVGLGCQWLLQEVWKRRPRLHIFGHVHAGHGRSIATWDSAQKSYERLRSRPNQGIWGFLDIGNWIDLLLMISSGVKGLIWSRLWGGSARCTTLINAALMSPHTGKIEQRIEVIDI